MASKSKTPSFRVTPEEDAHLRQAATDAGMKLSDYLRALVLHPTVAVVAGRDVVLIPSTITLEAADAELRATFAAILAALNSQEAGPAPATAGTPAPVNGAASAATAPPAVAPPAPDRPPASPGEGDGMVGKPPSQAPPTTNGAPVAGQVPGPGETCADCGGREGRHQGWCEQITGAPPVTHTEEAPAAAVSAGAETYEAFLARRTSEGELSVVAEAEWRQQAAAGAPEIPPESPAAIDRRAPCPSCGTLKLPEVQCIDCGARPTTI